MHRRRMGLTAGLGLLWIAASAVAAEPPAHPRTVVHVGHLIAEPGQPVRERQSLIVEDGTIVAVEDGFVAGDTVVDLTHAWVIPGLIDMHSHVTMTPLNDPPLGDFQLAYLGRPVPRAFGTLERARTFLRAGFTTLRNLGDPSSVTYDVADAIEGGQFEGPRIIGVEPQFETPGGDYMAYNFGERADVEPLLKNRGTCAGATDCERAVRDEIRRGAGVIKLRLSYQSVRDPASGPVETPAEINAIIATAHRLHRTVATHSAGSSAANQLAIEAGTDTLEHGPVSDENIAAMKRHGTFYTPTLLTTQLAIERFPKDIPPGLLEHTLAGARRAHAAGIPLLFGSDFPIAPVDQLYREFLLMTQVGLTPAEALQTATTHAARALGRSETLGALTKGHAADLVALADNPLDQLATLAHPIAVMKAGRLVTHADETAHPPTP